LRGDFDVYKQGRIAIHSQKGIITDPKYLQFLVEILRNLSEVYPAIVALGGEIVPLLRSIHETRLILGLVADQLVNDICKDTSKRLKRRIHRLLCPDCLVRFSTHWIHGFWIDALNYYGCRACHQSRRFIELDNHWIIAVLNSQLAEEQFQDEAIIRVNWSVRRRLFDFDEVKIVQATDEEVERFAVQVGNDTDPVRKPGYQQMRCTVSPDCQLSENTMRILRQVFKRVEINE
jgi:hypothetical protein